MVYVALANLRKRVPFGHLSQSLRFVAPVRAGDTVHAAIVVKEIVAGRSRVLLSTECTVRGVLVITGVALVLLPAPPPLAMPFLERAENMIA